MKLLKNIKHNINLYKLNIKDNFNTTKYKFNKNNQLLGDNYIDDEVYKNYVLFKYDYQNFKSPSVNLGDYVQTIATEKVVDKLFAKVNKTYFDRDNLSNYNGEKSFCIMQGWYSSSNAFFPSNNLAPVYLGMHFTKKAQMRLKLFLKKHPNYFKDKEIGCRDYFTKKSLEKFGLKTYLSRCLTLTLPKREETKEQTKVFISDFPESMLKYIPENLRNNASFIIQRETNKGHSKEYYAENYQEFYNQTKDLLDNYSANAKLVITSALHCASPCVAMGIPVILINKKGNKNARLGALKGIIPIYSFDDLKTGKVDFNPVKLDIKELKEKIIKNVELSVKLQRGENINIEELEKIREYIGDFSSVG